MLYTCHLSLLPEDARSRDESRYELDDVFGEARRAEVAFSHHTEDLVDGVVGGESAVEDVEGALEAFGNVVTTASWLDHRPDELFKQQDFQCS